MPERSRLALGGDDDACKAGELRQQLGCGTYESLRVVRMQLAFEAVDFDLLQRLDFQQRVNEDAISAWSRDSARGGMGTGDEAEFLKVRHDIADCRRTEIESGVLGEGS